MKKFLIIIAMFMMLPVFADTMPFYMNSIPDDAIGVYQTGKEFIIYSNPDKNSSVVKRFNLSYKPDTMPVNLFAVLLNEKELGFLYVTDIGDDGWVEVIYNKQIGAKGWVLTEDRLQFLPWLNFYNLYGRKYGLRYLKDTPKELQVLKAKSEDNSQTVSRLNLIKQMKLTKVQGNWALVTVKDLDQVPKTGYMKWRNSDGKIYAFPNIR